MKKLLEILLFIMLFSVLGKAQETYTITIYNPVPSQCSGNHLKTADGSMIDLEKLENGTLKWCAVSRDMLREDYKYGDKIEILHADTKIAGIYEIHDTMSSRFSKHIDILMPEHIRTGKWTGVMIRKIPNH